MQGPPQSDPPLPASSPDLIRGPIWTHPGRWFVGQKAAAMPLNATIGSDAAMGPRITSGDDAGRRWPLGRGLPKLGEPA